MRRSSTGFTLLEVMVAVAIMGVIMTLVWSSTSQSLNSKERIEKRDLIFHSGSVALRKMSEDLSMAFLAKSTGQASSATQSTLQPEAGAPTPPPAFPPASGQTQPETFKTFLIGIDNGDKDSVKFTSLAHLRLFKDAKESDQCKISYELAASESEGGGMNLLRSEEPWLDATAEFKRAPSILVEDVRSLEIEYYDLRKGEWVKNWDTEKLDWQAKLPMAVRITISFIDPDDDEKSIPMSTAAMLPLSRGPVEF